MLVAWISAKGLGKARALTRRQTQVWSLPASSSSWRRGRWGALRFSLDSSGGLLLIMSSGLRLAWTTDSPSCRPPLNVSTAAINPHV